MQPGPGGLQPPPGGIAENAPPAAWHAACVRVAGSVRTAGPTTRRLPMDSLVVLFVAGQGALGLMAGFVWVCDKV